MRLHRPVVEQVVSALAQIFGATEDGKTYQADKVIERVFKSNRKLGARDRRFIAETTYDIVRWWRMLRVAVGREHMSDPDKRESRLEVQELWQVLGAWLMLNDHELPPWSEFKSVTLQLLEQNRGKVQASLAVRESIPDWLFAVGSQELGSRWPEILAELNKPAPVVLRANRLKITREQLQDELRREDIDSDLAPACADGLILRERKNVFATEAFKFGYFEVQDGASQQAAPLLRVDAGQRVVDGCAGAGGKSLHLAAIMRNKGKIIAMDIYQKKLEELRRRCTRAGVDIVEARLIESSKDTKRLEKSVDRVLLDVPCSGLGVLRRNPDKKWKLRPDDLGRLHALQSEILTTYSQMLKPGGRLVYATCSILPSENELQVQAFLAARLGSWKLIEERHFWPGENGYDGFYTAALERLS